MRKHLILIIIIFISATACYAADKPVLFITNGVPAAFDEYTGVPYINREERTMMPVRACLNAIGCDVDWEPLSRTVVTRKGNVTVKIPVDENEIMVNEFPVKIDTVAVIINGRTYLPLRAVLEAYGYAVDWEDSSRTVYATELTAFNINGGTTGIFQRKQLHFSGFDGIRADITLPFVPELEKSDCPYVYFGFDWEGDKGNVEGGFQFIEDSVHPHYNKWTVFMRQGNEWRWGNNISIEQGETRGLNFYVEYISEGHTDLVIELDGLEIIRKKSAVDNFENASVKAVIAMGMNKGFDGQNCFSKSIGAKISNLEVCTFGSSHYSDFSDYPLFSSWRPEIGASGMWFGTSNCVPSYIHYEPNGKISLYNSQL